VVQSAVVLLGSRLGPAAAASRLVPSYPFGAEIADGDCWGVTPTAFSETLVAGVGFDAPPPPRATPAQSNSGANRTSECNMAKLARRVRPDRVPTG
jgi:hypothetical protein